MPIPLTCPQCRKQHNAPDSLAGKQARCRCGAVLQIPVLASIASTTSLFDELSASDIDRLQNRQLPPSTEVAHVNPYHSPVAARYLARAGTHRSRGADRWLTPAIAFGLVGTVILIAMSFWGLGKIASDHLSSPAQRQARAAEFGGGLGVMAVLAWAPATFILGRRWGRRFSGRSD